MPTWERIAGVSPCGSESCAAVHRGVDGRLFVQGRRATDDLRTAFALRAEEDAVEVSRELLEEALEALRHSGSER